MKVRGLKYPLSNVNNANRQGEGLLLVNKKKKLFEVLTPFSQRNYTSVVKPRKKCCEKQDVGWRIEEADETQ